MLTYYHGTDEKSANSILQNGADINRGGGELGMGFYIGSSLWRAYSWAWQRSQEKSNANSKIGFSVIEYKLDESKLHDLDILCLNRMSAEKRFSYLKTNNCENQCASGHDAIWGPLVGGNIRGVYQIKFESFTGQNYINQQDKQLL